MSATERFLTWIDVTQRKPPCKRDPDALGVEVLIWPRDIHDVGATAFYGRRATGRPAFYKHGASIEGLVTHWAYLPDGPAVGKKSEPDGI
jgi:hypothetical protein